MNHVRWVPCPDCMACPEVADGDYLQLYRVAANTLNKRLQTANKGWPSSLGAGHGANNLST
jgi:hypothetical protein